MFCKTYHATHPDMMDGASNDQLRDRYLIGSLFVVSKVIVQSVPVFVASFLRQFLAFLVLALWLYRQKSPMPQIQKRDYWVLFIQGFVGIFLFSIFALYGLKYTNAIDANIITSTTPLSMMLIAVLLLGERLTARRMGAAQRCSEFSHIRHPK